MKLTKGKISKLYRKNKQSLKRYKNKETNKNKSFRKSTHVNLRNKSLKNYKGGKEENKKDDEKDDAESSFHIDIKKNQPEKITYPPDLPQSSLSKEDSANLNKEPIATSSSEEPLATGSTQESLATGSTQGSLATGSTQESLAPGSTQENSPTFSFPDLTQQSQNEIEKNKEEETKALEKIPEVTDSEAAASPFLAEVKNEKEEGGPEKTDTLEQGPEQTDAVQTTEGGPEKTDTLEQGPEQTEALQTGEETNALQTTEGEPAQTTESGPEQTDAAQTTESGHEQTTEEGEPVQTGEETNDLQTTEEGPEQTDAVQTGEETNALQTTEGEPAQTTEETGPAQTGEESSQQQKQNGIENTSSGEGLPENVSVAAKTILDYAMGSLAKQINSSTISQGVQNPESAFTNMTNTFASQGGKSRKSKLKVKGKKTRKH